MNINDNTWHVEAIKEYLEKHKDEDNRELKKRIEFTQDILGHDIELILGDFGGCNE